MTVTRRAENGCGYVVLTAPPVNAIGAAMRQALLEAVDWAEAENLSRVILSGAGRAFAAGADAREFDQPPVPPHLPDILNRIETSAIPWIAAIHGPALGGGAEITLACSYRIARADATLGLPEVTLGVVPGAGGTQRLPRLIGVAQALDLISTGRALTGAQAKEIGWIDALDDDPIAAALRLPDQTLAQIVTLRDTPPQNASPQVFETAREKIAKKMRGQIAPHKAIELVQLAQTAPLTEGLATERACFVALRSTDQARALRHVFFAERQARKPHGIDTAPVDLTHVAVVGGGTMGAGIAYGLMNAGLRVTLLETTSEAAARAERAVHSIVEASQTRGLIDADQAQARRDRLTVTDDYAQAHDAELAIEAVFESLEVKAQVFRALDAALSPHALLATNTSYLDINEIAGSIADPSRVLGLHFFAPAHIMKLLEIVRGAASSDRALATGFALAKRMGKTPVLAGVCDGFIGNRILTRYRDAGDAVMIDGATPWQIDAAMTDFGYAMGPYETQDLSGLDIAFANRRRQDATRDPARRYVTVADQMVAEQRLGRKSGRGWYLYPDTGGKRPDPTVEELITEEAERTQVARRTFSDDEIRHRLCLAMINEAAQILAEGIADSAADIDLVTIHGYGFPRWRGGLMHYADTIGAKTILDGLKTLAKEDPLAWSPSQVIEVCATKGLSFAQWSR